MTDMDNILNEGDSWEWTCSKCEEDAKKDSYCPTCYFEDSVRISRDNCRHNKDYPKYVNGENI